MITYDVRRWYNKRTSSVMYEVFRIRVEDPIIAPLGLHDGCPTYTAIYDKTNYSVELLKLHYGCSPKAYVPVEQYKSYTESQWEEITRLSRMISARADALKKLERQIAVEHDLGLFTLSF